MKLTLSIAAVVLAACATQPDYYDGRAKYPVTQAAPFGYETAYQAGCASGELAAGHPYRSFTKDVQAYSGNPNYKQGWDDGFAVCKGRYEAVGRALQR